MAEFLIFFSSFSLSSFPTSSLSFVLLSIKCLSSSLHCWLLLPYTLHSAVSKGSSAGRRLVSYTLPIQTIRFCKLFSCRILLLFLMPNLCNLECIPVNFLYCRECSRMMVNFHQMAGVGKLTGVHRKYSTFKFGCAAKSEPALFLLD